MTNVDPGRNEPCPCASGRKYKHCGLQDRAAEDSARVRLRAAEGRVVEALLQFITETWGEPLISHAWEDFWNYEDVPEDLPGTPEFDPMFVPWLLFGFVPDPASDEAEDDWPDQPIGQVWLETTHLEVSPLDRTYIETACRSPMSVLAAKRLGQTATLIETTVVDPSHAIGERAGQRAAGDRYDESPPDASAELREIEEEMYRRHWTAWLDTRVPALGNKTPRQAARTARGRERLEALLAEFDRRDADQHSGNAPHLAAIRDALALTKTPGSGEGTR